MFFFLFINNCNRCASFFHWHFEKRLHNKKSKIIHVQKYLSFLVVKMLCTISTKRSNPLVTHHSLPISNAPKIQYDNCCINWFGDAKNGLVANDYIGVLSLKCYNKGDYHKPRVTTIVCAKTLAVISHITANEVPGNIQHISFIEVKSSKWLH